MVSNFTETHQSFWWFVCFYITDSCEKKKCQGYTEKFLKDFKNFSLPIKVFCYGK